MVDSKIRKDYDGNEYRNYSVVVAEDEVIYGRLYKDLPESYAHYDESGTAWMTNVDSDKLRAFLIGKIDKDIFVSYVMERYRDVQEYVRTQNCGTVGYEADEFEEWFWEKAKSWTA